MFICKSHIHARETYEKLLDRSRINADVLELVSQCKSSSLGLELGLSQLGCQLIWDKDYDRKHFLVGS